MGLILLLAATVNAGQAPVQTAVEREQALNSAQQRAGAEGQAPAEVGLEEGLRSTVDYFREKLGIA